MLIGCHKKIRILGRYRVSPLAISEPRYEKTSSGFPTRSHTNWAAQPRKMVRVLKFRM